MPLDMATLAGGGAFAPMDPFGVRTAEHGTGKVPPRKPIWRCRIGLVMSAYRMHAVHAWIHDSQGQLTGTGVLLHAREPEGTGTLPRC